MKEASASTSGSSSSHIRIFLRVRPTNRPSPYLTLDAPTTANTDEDGGGNSSEEDDDYLYLGDKGGKRGDKRTEKQRLRELQLSKNKVIFDVPPQIAAGYVNNTKCRYEFKFDGLLDMDANQDQVFRQVGQEVVQNALDGFNSTIFAYGQTGSGKTFTITGGPERYSDRGIIPRAISMVFNESRKRGDIQYQVYVSYLEIYNEQGYDLLDTENADRADLNSLLRASGASSTHARVNNVSTLPKVSMMEDEDGNILLKNLSMHLAATEEDALNYLFVGDTNRAISETAMNQASSRSHCIFTISLEGRRINSKSSRGGGNILRSKLNLVDLAGSERVHKTHAEGSILKEAKSINSSLFFLEMVILALHEKKSHIPYRNSMMTSVLRDSLGGNCKTAMIATISAEKPNTEESISTCRFAQRVAMIQNDAAINEEVDHSIVIKKLKEELRLYREEIAFLKGETGEEDDKLTEEAKRKIISKCKEYINFGKEEAAAEGESKEEKMKKDKDKEKEKAKLNIGKLTLSAIHYTFSVLRDFVLRAQAGEDDSDYDNDNDNFNDNNNNDEWKEDSSNNHGCRSSGHGKNKQKHEDIRLMKETIKQRDNEIAILVNMVKNYKRNNGKEIEGEVSGGDYNGKGVGIGMGMVASYGNSQNQNNISGSSDTINSVYNSNYIPGSLSTSMSSSASLSSSSSSLNSGRNGGERSFRDNNGEELCNIQYNNKTKNSNGSEENSFQAISKKMRKSKEERLIENLNLIVPFPPPPSSMISTSNRKYKNANTATVLDHPLLDDAKVAFSYFQEYHPKSKGINENKSLLKEKYDEAKELASRVNQARASINYMKKTIEQIRKENALKKFKRNRKQKQKSESKEGNESGQSENEDEDDNDEDEDDDNNANEGEDNEDEDEDEDEEKESEEESVQREAIENEKQIYHKLFTKLRELKSEIESIQKLVEKNRANLQLDFDEWYNKILDVKSLYEQRKHNKSDSRETGDSEEEAGTQSQLPSSFSSEETPESEDQGERRRGGREEKKKREIPAPISTSTSRLMKQSRQEESKKDSDFSSSSSSSVSSSFSSSAAAATAAAVPITGNKQTDQDIMSFYRARDELLRKKRKEKEKLQIRET